MTKHRFLSAQATRKALHMDVKDTTRPSRQDAFRVTARRFRPANAAPSSPQRPQPGKTEKTQGKSVPGLLWWLMLCGLLLLLPNAAFALLHVGAALVLVALLDPLVTFLVRRNVPRLLAVLALLCLTVALLATVLSLLWPYLTREIATLSATLQADEAQKLASKLGVLLLKAFPWLRTKNILLQLQAEFAPIATVFVQTALSFEVAVLSNFISYGIVAVFVFYLLRWQDQARSMILRAVPNRHLEATALFLERVPSGIGRYLRARALLFCVASTVLAIAFHLMHLPGIVSMSVYGALALLLPYWGALVGAIPIAIAAMNSTNSVNIVFGIVIAMAMMQVLNNIVLFSIERRKIARLTPGEGLLGLLLGACFGGVWGILLGGPLLALGKIVLQEALRGLRRFRE